MIKLFFNGKLKLHLSGGSSSRRQEINMRKDAVAVLPTGQAGAIIYFVRSSPL
jgi:hypothetical protein